MIAQARDRIAERPGLALFRAAIDARIVRGRMALGTIGEELDQRRPGIRAGAVGRPALGGVDRKRVVAVDAQAGDAVALRPSGKGRALSPGDAREARYRPLVVDDVEDRRRVVDGREDQGSVEIAFGARALADPRCRDTAVVLHRAGHRET